MLLPGSHAHVELSNDRRIMYVEFLSVAVNAWQAWLLLHYPVKQVQVTFHFRNQLVCIRISVAIYLYMLML